MPHIRIHIALRALPVSTLADGVNAVAEGGLDCFCSQTPRDNTAMPRRRFDGVAIQN